MAIVTFSGNANYRLDVDATVQSQNQAAKTSTIYWRVIVHKTAGSGYWSSTNMGNTGSADSSVGGSPDLWNATNLAYDFRNGSMWVMSEGTFVVQHDAAGYGSYFVNGNMNLVNLGSAAAGTGWRDLPRLATVPDAPTPIALDQITQTDMRYRFSGNGSGGLPIIEWQIGYGLDPAGPTWYVGSDGNTTVGKLDPARMWYFWSRGRNDLGWGPWSARREARTVAGARIKVNDVWKEAIPYVNVNGVWKIAQPYVMTAGKWKKST